MKQIIIFWEAVSIEILPMALKKPLNCILQIEPSSSLIWKWGR